MIVAERKPLEAIRQMMDGRRSVLLVGCGTCTTICWAGGEKEVAVLSSQLSLASRKDSHDLSILEATIERQCEKELVEPLADKVRQVEAIWSLGCGAGVQTIAEAFPQKPVYPALDTKFIGAPRGEGVWVETCGACGDCFLDRTGGICPIVRCAKGLLNGPCGGTNKGKCEVDSAKDCAWTLIYRRLKEQGRLELMRKYRPKRNYGAVVRPETVSSPAQKAPVKGETHG